MDFITCIIVFSALYGTLFFFDMFFKTCAHYPYIQFLKNTGFEVGFFRAKWKTTFFNRYLLRMGHGRTKLLNFWFDAGLYVSLALLPLVIGMLVVATFQLLIISKTGASSDVVLQVNLPGINIPSSELGYYVSALFVCSVVHEFGHALAAVKEDVHVVDMGFSLIFVVPVAFVSISSEKLSSIGQWKSLRFLCAGVWHNVVLAVVAGALSWALPSVLSPLYSTGAGVVVTHVAANSPLLGPRGVAPGDTISQINECMVRDEAGWQHCLSRARTLRTGYCVSADIQDLDESGPLVQSAAGVWDCCDAANSRNICFEYLELSGGAMGLRQHMCLPARHVVEQAEFNCYSDARHCPAPLHCVRPLLSNATSLMLVRRPGQPGVVYLGHPADLFTTVYVSPFVPRYSFPGTQLAARTDRFLTYLLAFSTGLAVLNLIPCFFLDGEHIFKSLTVIVLRDKLSRSSMSSLSVAVNMLGTIMILVNLIHSSWEFIFQT